ncbi:hypothetical protein [Bdellovibrio svalbardensis]|uniref:Uncharacterized protein n=1 Tax=Bdellovibrio svalbardensis TaxID=2972972 RepID=A0ABT6DE87_9BACT|nr:hypothetical protein [Bdellovibrio svalbardensis]MDG0815127.1 hypothetical protein [Bdellovibrio svalbardensis]
MNKLVLSLLSLTFVISFNAQAIAAPACMSDTEARDTLHSQEKVLLKMIKKQYGAATSRTSIPEGVATTAWDDSRNVFLTGTLYYWACGPGAECWIHATLSCDGDVSLIEFGD